MVRKYICASDEVGFGCMAGPLLVVACASEVGWRGLPGLTDSKKLSESMIALRFEDLRKESAKGNVEFFPVWVPAKYIDSEGLHVSNKAAHATAHSKFTRHGTDHVADGSLSFAAATKIRSVVKADATIIQAMAASIYAKHLRDEVMRGLGRKHTNFSFAEHKGYVTPKHKQELAEFGPISEVHRFSYYPVQTVVEQRRKNNV